MQQLKMENSRVYRHLNFLASLRETRGRRQLLQNMTSAQTKAVAEVAKRIADGTINPMRRDVATIERKRLAIRTLASTRESLARKKQVLKKHHALLTVLLRERYVIRTVVEEIRRAREQ